MVFLIFETRYFFQIFPSFVFSASAKVNQSEIVNNEGLFKNESLLSTDRL